MKRNNQLLLLFFLLFAFACSSPDSLNKKELEEHLYHPDNGLTQRFTSDRLELEVTYRPTELVWYNDLKQMGVEESDSLLRTFENRYYFVAKYTNLDQSSIDPLSTLTTNKELYHKVLSNLSFRYEQFVSLKLSSGEEINAGGSIFSKSYGMIPYNLVLFYFEDERISKEEKLKIHLSDIGFGLHPQPFTFSRNDILKIPDLIPSLS